MTPGHRTGFGAEGRLLDESLDDFVDALAQVGESVSVVEEEMVERSEAEEGAFAEVAVHVETLLESPSRSLYKSMRMR